MNIFIKVCLLIVLSFTTNSFVKGLYQPAHGANAYDTYRNGCFSLTAKKIRTLLEEKTFKRYFQAFGTRIFYDPEVSYNELIEVGKQCRAEIEEFFLRGLVFAPQEFLFISHCTDGENMLLLINHMRWSWLRDWEIIRLIKLLILAYVPEHIELIRSVHYAQQSFEGLIACKQYLEEFDFAPSTIIDYCGTTLLGLAAYYNWIDFVEYFLHNPESLCSEIVINGENASGWTPLSLAVLNSNDIPAVLLMQEKSTNLYDHECFNIVGSNGYSLRAIAQKNNCSEEIFQLLDEYDL